MKMVAILVKFSMDYEAGKAVSYLKMVPITKELGKMIICLVMVD